MISRVAVPTRRDAQGNDARSLAVAQGHDALVAVLDAALRARR